MIFNFKHNKVYFGKDQLGHLHGEVLKYGKVYLLFGGGGSIKNRGFMTKL